MLAGWSTNSIDGDPHTALNYLADLGFHSLALTPDRHLLNPFSATFADERLAWQRSLESRNFHCVVETGARHLLDPLQKHEPTLVSTASSARTRRIEFLTTAIDLAVALRAGCVSLWSGVVRDAASEPHLWDRLTESLKPVVDYAALRDIPLGFEPEPGMFVDTLPRFDELRDRLGHPPHLRLTIDLGHMECMGEWPLVDTLRARVADIVNVHLDDMRPCIHEHLPLGTGVIRFPPLFAALHECRYTGGIHTELPRQSHRWASEAAATIAFLQKSGLPTSPIRAAKA
ncbi:MAG: sugar phosphate isomerase/epimerase family protein [Pirellulales bacterium]|jgi:L-ribulose-5-phosphate 3-epimerase